MSHRAPASSSVRGAVKLTGHLGGTSDSPTVVNHAQITGTSDLHTEYLLAAGTRALSGAQSFGGFKATSLANAESDSDAATWGQVVALFRNQDYKPSVRLATQGALAAYTRVANVITGDANGAIGDIDSVTPLANDRILLNTGAAAGADKGIYVLTTVGDGSNPFVLTRADDANVSAEVTSGMLIPVEEGTVSGGLVYRLTTTGAIDLNTTSLTFSLLSGAVSFGAISKLSGTAAADGDAPTAARSNHNHGVTPDSNGGDWGSGSLRWDVFARELNVGAGTVTAKTGDYTVTTGDFFVPADATSGAIVITLPAAASNGGRILAIRKVDSSANTVTIDANASETLDGATTLALGAQWETVLIVCDGTSWHILA